MNLNEFALRHLIFDRMNLVLDLFLIIRNNKRSKEELQHTLIQIEKQFRLIHPSATVRNLAGLNITIPDKEGVQRTVEKGLEIAFQDDYDNEFIFILELGSLYFYSWDYFNLHIKETPNPINSVVSLMKTMSKTNQEKVLEYTSDLERQSRHVIQPDKVKRIPLTRIRESKNRF